MKIREVRERNDEEMDRLAAQLKDDLYRLRVRRATNQLENTATLHVARRAVARALTVKRARELGIEGSRQGNG